jgi:hypothetical protein
MNAINNNIWAEDYNSSQKDIMTCFKQEFPDVNFNQININVTNNYFKTQDFINSLFVKNLGQLNTLVYSTITLSAVEGSNTYNGSVVRNFPIVMNAQDFNYTGTAQKFTTPIEGTYLMET